MEKGGGYPSHKIKTVWASQNFGKHSSTPNHIENGMGGMCKEYASGGRMEHFFWMNHYTKLRLFQIIAATIVHNIFVFATSTIEEPLGLVLRINLPSNADHVVRRIPAEGYLDVPGNLPSLDECTDAGRPPKNLHPLS